MKTIAWLVGGFALLGLAGYLENTGSAGTAAGGPLAINIPATLAVLGASTCFFRALRSALAAIVGAMIPKKAGGTPTAAKARPAPRFSAPQPAEQFDIDAAFAHYMEQREANLPDLAGETPAPKAVSPSQPAFGRRVL